MQKFRIETRARAGAAIVLACAVNVGGCAAYQDAAARSRNGGTLDQAQAAEAARHRALAAQGDLLAKQERTKKAQLTRTEQAIKDAEDAAGRADKAAAEALASMRLSAAQRAKLTSQQSALQHEVALLQTQQKLAATTKAAPLNPKQESDTQAQYEALKKRADELQSSIQGLQKAAVLGR